MKNIKTIGMMLLTATLLVLSSCSKDINDSFFEPKDPVITFPTENVTIEYKGGNLEVKMDSNLPWIATTKGGWIQFESDRGLSGEPLKLKISRNRIFEDRAATITVRINDEYSKEVTIKQDAAEPRAPMTFYVKETGDADADGETWATAIPLDIALQYMMPLDIIRVAAGKYVPTEIVTGGDEKDASDMTFEIHSNVLIEGGYPADAKDGDVADPKANLTILSGKLATTNSYHTVTITAEAVAGQKVELKNLQIQEGITAKGTAITLNGVGYSRANGGGVIVGVSVVDMTDCIITNNSTSQHAGGMYVFAGAKVTMERCTVSKNMGLASGCNAAGIYNDAATMTLKDCSVVGNTTSGVAAGIYAFNSSKKTYTYLYNTTIANNNNDVTGVSATRGGGGMYARENSQTVMVNCTVYGNEGGNGGGVYAYGANTKMTIISSTIAHNLAQTGGGGLMSDPKATVVVHNSIIANNVATIKPETSDFSNGGLISLKNSVLATKILDNAGAELAGVVFNPATISTIADNGGFTETCLLTGATNTARTNGMAVSDLVALGNGLSPKVPEAISKADQLGAARQGKVIGACVK